MSQALAQTEVAGTVTNLGFLGALAGHAGFGRGEVDTGLIARDLAALTAQPAMAPRHAVAAAMTVAGLDVSKPMAGFHMWQPLRRFVPLTHGDAVLDIVVEVMSETRQRWHVDGLAVAAECRQGRWWVDGQPLPNVAMAGGQVTVFDGYGICFDVVDVLDVAAGVAGDGNVIEAPMPGLVKEMFAKPGAQVYKGDRLAILEAMKMEHALLAARDGTVAEVLATRGDQVSAGAALVRLEDEGTA